MDQILDEPPRHHDRNVEVPGLASQHGQHVLVGEPEWKAWLETCNLQADPWLDIVACSAQSCSDGSQNDGTDNDSGHA